MEENKEVKTWYFPKAWIVIDEGKIVVNATTGYKHTGHLGVRIFYDTATRLWTITADKMQWEYWGFGGNREQDIEEVDPEFTYLYKPWIGKPQMRIREGYYRLKETIPRRYTTDSCIIIENVRES